MVILASFLVYAQAHLGTAALALLVVLFFLYLHLYRELIVSQERGEELERRTEQLASLQVGVLTAMLRTLSMRDQMTARHSAAVARYAREIAKAAGCSEEEQDLAHTAGLLHDIGKFILPDHILLAEHEAQRRGLAAHQDAPVPGREGRARGRGLRPGRGHHLGAPRAHRRPRLPARPRRRRHPAASRG